MGSIDSVTSRPQPRSDLQTTDYKYHSYARARAVFAIALPRTISQTRVNGEMGWGKS
jgi:hypothetical protein